MVKLVRNYLRGAGSVLEISPPPRRSRLDEVGPAQSDEEALGEDWQRVGDDMRAAMKQVASEEGKRGQSQ